MYISKLSGISVSEFEFKNIDIIKKSNKHIQNLESWLLRKTFRHLNC